MSDTFSPQTEPRKYKFPILAGLGVAVATVGVLVYNEQISTPQTLTNLYSWGRRHHRREERVFPSDHDASACMDRWGEWDDDCCQKKHKGACDEGFIYEKGQRGCGLDYGHHWFSTICKEAFFPPTHDSSACKSGSGWRERYDEDCCAVQGSGSCESGFVYSEGDERCKNNDKQHVQTYCTPRIHEDDRYFPEDHDDSACREDNQFDDNCCAWEGEGSCQNGFTFRMGPSGCRRGDQDTYSTYCTPDSLGRYFPDGHVTEACQDDGIADDQCCSRVGDGGCADRFQFNVGEEGCGRDYGSEWVSTYCTRSQRYFPSNHVAWSCNEGGEYDNDCCTVVGDGSCEAGYEYQQGESGCGRKLGDYFTSTYCIDNSQAVERHFPSDHTAWACNENGDFDNDCCTMQGQGSCADGFTYKEGETGCGAGWADYLTSTYCTPQEWNGW